MGGGRSTARLFAETKERRCSGAGTLDPRVPLPSPPVLALDILNPRPVTGAKSPDQLLQNTHPQARLVYKSGHARAPIHPLGSLSGRIIRPQPD